jgi:hypothetical protein
LGTGFDGGPSPPRLAASVVPGAGPMSSRCVPVRCGVVSLFGAVRCDFLLFPLGFPCFPCGCRGGTCSTGVEGPGAVGHFMVFMLVCVVALCLEEVAGVGIVQG